MYKCMVFDLDGTVADTLTTISYYGNTSLEKFGLETIDKEKYKKLVGNGYINLIRNMLLEIGKEGDPVFDELAPFYHDEYEKDSTYLTKAYEGIPELLKALKEKGFKLAVFSNKPHGATEKVVGELFGDMFDICYGAREGFPLKPDPSVLFEILESFDAKPSECIYVGDTSTDMKTGKNAGAFTVGVLWGFRDRDELEKTGADLIVSHPDEILKYIESV